MIRLAAVAAALAAVPAVSPGTASANHSIWIWGRLNYGNPENAWTRATSRAADSLEARIINYTLGKYNYATCQGNNNSCYTVITSAISFSTGQQGIAAGCGVADSHLLQAANIMPCLGGSMYPKRQDFSY